MNKSFAFLLAAGSLCLAGNSAFAVPVTVSGPVILSSQSGNTTTPQWGPLNYTAFDKYGKAGESDTSNASSPYSSTGNTKGQWQGLGTSNGIDNGVKWSVGNSGFGTDADLVIGQEVTFKFLFWQANNGNHTYDQIFAAFDFGQDGWSYSNNTGLGNVDTILYQKIDTINLTNNPVIRDDVTKTLSRYLEYTVSFKVPETMTIGTTWLRARATCWHTEYPGVYTDNWLGQGETEDYQLNIVRAPVPEPASMLLFGTGLLGLAGFIRRRG